MQHGRGNPADRPVPYVMDEQEKKLDAPIRYYTQPDNLNTIFVPEKRTMTYRYQPQQAYNDLQADMDHEWEHGSEDFDFYAEDFMNQHFKKQGFNWPWWFVITMPFYYFWSEYLYARYPDEYHWRKPMPCGLDEPDKFLAPDS